MLFYEKYRYTPRFLHLDFFPDPYVIYIWVSFTDKFRSPYLVTILVTSFYSMIIIIIPFRSSLPFKF